PGVLVEDALLFLGYSGTGELAGLDSDLGSGVIVVTLLVTATSALIVGWWARRTLRPIGAMTVATAQMAEGDLSVRVDEGVGGELGELATSFNNMVSSLAAEDDRRRRLTNDVAHELRTPLANVAGYLEAADDGLVEIGPALFEILRDETSQLSHIVDDLQDLSLAESGRLHLIKTDVRLSEVIRTTVASFGSRAESAGVELRTTVSTDDPISVVGDPARLRQIATNLVENAIRHTEAGGQVVVRAERAGDMVDFSISDTGVGMSDDEVAHVFERFYRADESRSRATGGSGLGLAIVHQLVTAMGGTIAVTSGVGVGSTFTVSLPVGDG
ncbi:MAG: HAMP domain-containing protein, partial [Actinobacteria bacterium]|nr:HAMP domain-containing protein [Actinomycetota bacterium]